MDHVGQLMRWLAALLVLTLVPLVSADHVSSSDIRWACGGGSRHPDSCGIDPVGGGEAVKSVGEPSWSEDAWIDGDDQVLGVVVDGQARAVPVRLLDAHEIVNAKIGQTDVAITYCPLCGSGITFERRVTIDETATVAFAASGFLFQSDLVMWDDHWGILWNQITGKPIATLDGGVQTDHPDVKLTRIPTVLTTLDAWQDEHPNSLTLDRPRASGYTYPYGDYMTDSRRCGFESCPAGDLHPKEFVIGVEDGNVAFPRFAVQADGGVAVASGVVAAVDPNGIHRVWHADGRAFSPDPSGLWLDQDGHFWDLSAGTRTDGSESLREIEGSLMFWFAWQEHHPETALWLPAEAEGGLKVDNGKLPGFYIPVVIGLLILGGWLWRRR